MASCPSPVSQGPANLDVLDDEHRKVLDRAVRNVLNTEVAERVYAQIADGLPTEMSLIDSSDHVKDHPVYINRHTEICPGYIEKARVFRNQLRDGAHKHKTYEDWRQNVLEEKKRGVESRRYYDPPPIAFSHRAYRYPDQYPRGLADVAGYWAESKILGGVTLFDRGEIEQECKAIWIHGDLIRGPRTLYPPTKEQFDALIKFLTTPLGEGLTCPFPIHGASVNRPRWHPYHAFAYYHIFRDRYERKIPLNPPQSGCVEDGMDWPELDDRRILLLGGFSNPQGEPYVSDDEYAAATERIKNITPSSPLWRPSEI
ncbi:hypothetical protein FOC1_g10004633 [Fusarium oxysporum f. sp. cubense race 1]|uniref:Uncharacterized protein n=1 Tax=Fusarium oxysporum f. sp. cubense (strain race 1) TaxID=1229664 RepID=N4UDX7_FUSC1|nr:hypothetical protein FOC1_g10004633 [Fusarium oxysporum f. sp. cubense race 1]